MTEQSNGSLRSQAWFGGTSRDVFIHRSWMRNQGLPDDVFDGRPIIGICNTYSELTPCNAHFRRLADKVKQGVLQAVAGGLGSSQHRGIGRTDVKRPLQGTDYRIRNQRLAVLGSSARRTDDDVRVFGSGSLHVPERWPLYDNGNGFYDGIDGRSARCGPAAQCCDSRG